MSDPEVNIYDHVNLFDYEVLSEEHGCQPYAAVSPDTIEKYRGKVPETLLAIWERHGLTSHGEGQLWFTNPDEFADIIEALFGQTRPFIVYARDSFGRMSAVLGDRLYAIHSQIARAIHGNRTDVFDTTISSGLIRPQSNFYREHQQALRKLGPIQADQMFGYVPVLALGGEGTLEETQVVQMHEYLLMVADLAIAALQRGWDPLGQNARAGS